MTNYNNQDPHNRGVYSNQGDPTLDGQVNPANVPVNAQTPVQDQPLVNQTSPQPTYRDGYYQGRQAERYQAERYNEELRAREGDGAATGLMTGLLLAALVALGAGAFFFFNQQNRPRTVVPTVIAPSASPSPSPKVQERIIERDRIVPVPQTVAPPPDVNITVPPAQQAPSTRSAPTQQAPSTQSSSSPRSTSSDTGTTQSGTTTGEGTTGQQSGASGQ